MVSTKLNIGKIPISKGEYQEGTTYQRLNQVTMLGSTYQSKIDDNTSAPAQMGADGAVENINTDKWLCIAVGNVSAAKKVVYNNETSGLEAGNVQEAIDETNTKVSDLSFFPISINTKGTIYNGNLITTDRNAFSDSIYHEILSNDIFVRYSNNGDYPKIRATFYDKNKGYLSSTTYDRHTKISKPSNAKFVRFSINVEQANLELDNIDKNLVQLQYVEDKETTLLDVKKNISRIAAIYVGDYKKCIKFTKEDVEGVQHIKLYVKGGNVSILYENDKRISIDEDKNVDYTNTIGRLMFFVAIDVITKNFSIKDYSAPLGENEFFLFGFNSIFGANLPLDWVVYEGFDDNILINKLNNLSSKVAYMIVGSNKKLFELTKKDVDGVPHIIFHFKGNNLLIMYGNGKRVTDIEEQTVDYNNIGNKGMLYMVFNVATKKFSWHIFEQNLSSNEYIVFAYNNTFGASLPLNWVHYEGFDEIMSFKLDFAIYNPIHLDSKGSIWEGETNTANDAFLDSRYHEIYSDIFVKYGNDEEHPKLRVSFYDKNKTYLSQVGYDRRTKIIKPVDARFARFSITVGKENLELDAIDRNLVRLLYKEDEDALLKQKFDVLNEVSKEDIANVYADLHPSIVSMSSRPYNKYYGKNFKILPVFMVLTDLHSDKPRFVRALEFMGSFSEVSAAILLGDTYDNSNVNFNFSEVVTATTNKPVLAVCGNHEVLCRKEAKIKGMTDEEFINTFFPSTLDSQNNIIREENKCYWYKDFKSEDERKTVRVIGLYQFEYQAPKDSDGYSIDGEQGSGKGKDIIYYSQAQIDWLLKVLDNTDENTYVVIVEHYSMSSNMTPIDTPWNPSQFFNQPIEGGSNTGGSDNMSNNNFFFEIIQKWIDGGKVSVTSTLKNDSTTITAEHTFTAHNNQFIGYFSGHTHRDGVYRLTDYPNQYQFMFNLSANYEGFNCSDIGRSSTGKSQDCFTLVSYDWYNHRVNLLRVGADITTDMRERKMCSIALGG